MRTAEPCCSSLRCFEFRYTSPNGRSEEHTSELQSRSDLVCRLLLEKKKNIYDPLTSQVRKIAIPPVLRALALPAMTQIGTRPICRLVIYTCPPQSICTAVDITLIV